MPRQSPGCGRRRRVQCRGSRKLDALGNCCLRNTYSQTGTVPEPRPYYIQYPVHARAITRGTPGAGVPPVVRAAPPWNGAGPQNRGGRRAAAHACIPCGPLPLPTASGALSGGALQPMDRGAAVLRRAREDHIGNRAEAQHWA
jgi:hypothetical protein